MIKPLLLMRRQFWLIYTLFLLITFNNSYAQNSAIRRDYDVAFKKHLVRGINLNNPDNQSFFGEGNDLVRILLDAVKDGKLIPYKDGHLKDTLSLTSFLEKIKIPVDIDSSGYYEPYQLKYLEVGENLVFDKHRSEVKLEIDYLTIMIPSNVNYKEILEPIASFKFDDCVKVFRADERALRTLTPSQKSINLAEIFLLHLPKSYIVKLGTPGSNYFDQVASDHVNAFLLAKNEEEKIIDYFYKLFNPQ